MKIKQFTAAIAALGFALSGPANATIDDGTQADGEVFVSVAKLNASGLPTESILLDTGISVVGVVENPQGVEWMSSPGQTQALLGFFQSASPGESFVFTAGGSANLGPQGIPFEAAVTTLSSGQGPINANQLFQARGKVQAFLGDANPELGAAELIGPVDSSSTAFHENISSDFNTGMPNANTEGGLDVLVPFVAFNRTGLETVEELALGSFDIDSLTGKVSFTPVPLPAAVWLMGAALAGLLGMGRRQQPA